MLKGTTSVVLSFVLSSMLSGCTFTSTADITHPDGTVIHLRKGVFDDMTVSTNPPFTIGPSPVVRDGAVTVMKGASDAIMLHVIDKATDKVSDLK